MDLAGIGDILEITSRPRDSKIMSQEQYYDYREFLLNFLQERADEGREERSLFNESNPQTPLNAPFNEAQRLWLTIYCRNN